jgi:poly-gamma-glutamate synthesis protein (capsule biosynthesis protein)
MTSTRRRFLATAAAGVAALPAAVSAAPAAGALAGGRQRPRGAGAVLVFAGDLFLTHALAPASDAPATQLLDVLHGADLAVANLENGLSTVGSPELGGFRHGPSLRGHPSLVGELRGLNIRAVSLANNHTGNYGREALLQTRDVLDRAGVAHAGAGANIEEAFAPVYVDARGLTVALLSVYSYYYNFQANDTAGAGVPGVAGCRAFDVLLEVPTGFDTTARDESPYRIEPRHGGAQAVMAPLKEDVERLAASVKAARAKADVVVVSAHLHWGRHGKSDLAAQKRGFAHAAIDAGADLFVGHGPHALRGIEHYRGRTIAHSLCNFVLQRPASQPAPRPPQRSAGRESVLLRLTVARGEAPKVDLVPFVIPADGRPRLADAEIGGLILEKMTALSAALNTDLVVESGYARLAS